MRRIIAVLISLFSAVYAFSENLPTVDIKPIHFGFNLGLNVMDFGIRQSMTEINGKVYQAEVSSWIPGFSVGVFGDVRLGKYFNVRLVPTLMLGDRTLTYMNDKDDELFNTTLKSTIISVPLHLKYSSVRIKNYRVYMFAGGGVMFELSHDQSKPVLSRYMDYILEFGVGFTIYTQYFRLSPEFKFLLGFNNMITPWNERLEQQNGYVDPSFEPYTRSIDKLTSRIFSFVLNFE